MIDNNDFFFKNNHFSLINFPSKAVSSIEVENIYISLPLASLYVCTVGRYARRGGMNIRDESLKRLDRVKIRLE